MKRNKETQENSVECGIIKDTRRKAFGMRDADWSRVCSLWRTSLVRTEVWSVDSVNQRRLLWAFLWLTEKWSWCLECRLLLPPPAPAFFNYGEKSCEGLGKKIFSRHTFITQYYLTGELQNSSLKIRHILLIIAYLKGKSIEMLFCHKI